MVDPPETLGTYWHLMAPLLGGVPACRDPVRREDEDQLLVPVLRGSRQRRGGGSPQGRRGVHRTGQGRVLGESSRVDRPAGQLVRSVLTAVGPPPPGRYSSPAAATRARGPSRPGSVSRQVRRKPPAGPGPVRGDTRPGFARPSTSRVRPPGSATKRAKGPRTCRSVGPITNSPPTKEPSPRARGSGVAAAGVVRAAGSIPARAGNSDCRPAWGRRGRNDQRQIQ